MMADILIKLGVSLLVMADRECLHETVVMALDAGNAVGMGRLVANGYMGHGGSLYCPGAEKAPNPGWDVNYHTYNSFAANFGKNTNRVGAQYTFNIVWLNYDPFLPNRFNPGNPTQYWKIGPDANPASPLFADAWINASTDQRFINHRQLGLNAAYLGGHARWLALSANAARAERLQWGNVALGNAMDRFWTWLRDG